MDIRCNVRFSYLVFDNMVDKTMGYLRLEFPGRHNILDGLQCHINHKKQFHCYHTLIHQSKYSKSNTYLDKESTCFQDPTSSMRLWRAAFLARARARLHFFGVPGIKIS